jgi:hypothetical protein
MSAHNDLLLLACLILTCVPILSSQLPRYMAHRRDRNDKATQPSMFDGSDADAKPLARATSSSKRPWDPPFPTTNPRKGSEWRILPPSEPRASDGDVEQIEHEILPETVSHTPPSQTSHIQRPNDHRPTQSDRTARDNPGGMSVVWTIVAILAGILLVLLFAALIAHCLAWFIVYKTEARLGEARRGLVQGGEMRLCLCARG